MILRRVLQELESTREPTTLGELGRKLNVEPDALRGMIQFLVRKGRLNADQIVPCVTSSTGSPKGVPDLKCFHASCAAGCWQAGAWSEEE
jgi:predicted ArsR family transcriptional regulator